MPKRSPSPRKTPLTQAQRQRIAELRDLESRGGISLAANDQATVPSFVVTLRSSPDPTVAKLLDIDAQIAAIMDDKRHSPHFRVALEVALFALAKATLVTGAFPASGPDTEARHARGVALARVALKGRPFRNEAGLRAEVHDFLLAFARKHNFAALPKAAQRAGVDYVIRELPACAGSTATIDAAAVHRVLQLIASPDGCPKGSRRHAAPRVTAAQEKWQALYALFGRLRIAGSSPDALRRELSKTKKSTTMPKKLRET
jgi:hypothetical protein